MMTGRFAVTAALAATAAVAAAQVSIEIDSLDLAPGGAARVSVRLRATGDVGGTANAIQWTAPLRLSGCRVNPAIQRPATVFGYTPSACIDDCTAVRAIVFALTIAPPLRDGDVLYMCDVEVSSTAADGEYPLRCADADAGTPDGTPLVTGCVGGVIRVGPPTATPSASPAPEATATRPAAACAGDCDGDGRVSVDELVNAIRIALRSAAADTCPDADIDGNGDVSIDELVQAVRAALNGCPSPA